MYISKLYKDNEEYYKFLFDSHEPQLYVLNDKLKVLEFRGKIIPDYYFKAIFDEQDSRLIITTSHNSTLCAKYKDKGLTFETFAKNVIDEEDIYWLTRYTYYYSESIYVFEKNDIDYYSCDLDFQLQDILGIKNRVKYDCVLSDYFDEETGFCDLSDKELRDLIYLYTEDFEDECKENIDTVILNTIKYLGYGYNSRLYIILAAFAVAIEKLREKGEID